MGLETQQLLNPIVRYGPSMRILGDQSHLAFQSRCSGETAICQQQNQALPSALLQVQKYSSPTMANNHDAFLVAIRIRTLPEETLQNLEAVHLQYGQKFRVALPLRQLNQMAHDGNVQEHHHSAMTQAIQTCRERQTTQHQLAHRHCLILRHLAM